jgi:alkyl hydroperoxide reductase subunit AhpC
VCPTEILAFNDALSEFEEVSTAIIGMGSLLAPFPPLYGLILARKGISTDSQHSHLAWAHQPRARGGLGPDLRLPLVADKNMSISRAYGVLIPEKGIALRGMFLIDPKGIVRLVLHPYSYFVLLLG